MIPVREEQKFHFEPHQRHVTDGVQPPWTLLVDVAPNSFHEVITVTKKIENAVQMVTGLDFHTSTIEDICFERRLSTIRNAQHVYLCEEE